MVKNKRNGITLIALVITVIVLLVLAGVVFNLSMGENGILKKTKSSINAYNKQALNEELDIKYAEARIKAIEENKTINARYFADKLETEGFAVVVDDSDENSIIIKTNDGYLVTIINDNGKVKINIGEIIEIRNPIQLSITLEETTTNSIRVSITGQNNTDATYTYMCMYNDNTVKTYTGEETTWTADGLRANTSYIIKVIARSDTNGAISKRIEGKTGIDEGAPTASLTNYNTVAAVNQTMKFKANQSDNDSGLDLDNCKYIFNKDNTSELGIEAYANATKVGAEETVTVTPNSLGTWYIHLYTMDMAGNAVETISNGIVVKEGINLSNLSCQSSATVENVADGVKITGPAYNNPYGFVVFGDAIPVGKTVTVTYYYNTIDAYNWSWIKSCPSNHPDGSGAQNRQGISSTGDGSISWVVESGTQHVGIAISGSRSSGESITIKSIIYQ